MSPMFMRRPTSPEIVEAEQVLPNSQNSTGGRPARPGEWVVTNHTEGTTRVIPNEEFTREFMALGIPSHILAPNPAMPSVGPEPPPVPEAAVAEPEVPPEGDPDPTPEEFETPEEEPALTPVPPAGPRPEPWTLPE
jgi:hypothetical protein